MTLQDKTYDVLIIGQGASSYAAALYAARFQIRSVIFGAIFGGETATGGLIENYPGVPQVDGYELMMNFRAQTDAYDVPVVDENIVSLREMDGHFEATTEGGDGYIGSSVILAVGRERRKLKLPNEDEWTGRGVSFCSTCDAPLHRGNTVAVVGGGDAAVKGSVLLSKYAKQVYVIYRQESFTRPEAANLRQMEAQANIVPLYSTNVIELLGEDGLTGVVLDSEYQGSKELVLDGLFIEIGADPRIDLPNQLGLKLNEANEVMVDKFGRTNVDGVFAAGDLTDGAGDLKQTITAASLGAMAATAAYEYVSKHGDRCGPHSAGYSLATAD